MRFQISNQGTCGVQASELHSCQICLHLLMSPFNIQWRVICLKNSTIDIMAYVAWDLKKQRELALNEVVI
jgi:hypothetical protein